jgi:HEAT repeat protein
MKPRGRRAAIIIMLVGIATITGTGVALKDRAFEAWYIYRLDSKDAGDCISAMEGLARCGTRRAVLPLSGMIRHHPHLAVEAAAAMVQIGDEAVPALIDAIDDLSATNREDLIKAVDDQAPAGEPLAQLLVKVALEDRSRNVSHAAIQKISRVGDLAAPLVLHRLSDDRSVVCDTENPGPSDGRHRRDVQVDPIRKRALSAVEWIGPAAHDAIPIISAFLSSPDLDLPAADALASIGVAALPALRMAAEREDTHRAALHGILVLAAKSPAETLPMISEALTDPSESIRREALRALLALGLAAAAVLPDLLAVWKEPDFIPVESDSGSISLTSGSVGRGTPCPDRAEVLEAMLKIGPGRREVLDALIGAVADSSDPCLQGSAARALGKFGKRSPEAISVLTDLLRISIERPDDESPDEHDRSPAMGALEALANLEAGPEIPLPLLQSALCSPDPDLRAKALEFIRERAIDLQGLISGLIADLGANRLSPSRAAAALAAIGESARPAVLRALTDPSPASKAGAILALERLQDGAGDEDFSRIAAAAGDQSPVVRNEAIKVLNRWGGELGRVPVTRLISAFRDGDREARAAVLEMLGAVRSPEAVAALVEVLSLNPGPEMRARAARALGNLREPTGEAIHGLIGALKDDARATFEGDSEGMETRTTVRDEAVASLAAFGLPALPALRSVIADRAGEELRLAVKAVAEMAGKHEEARDALRPLLDRHSLDVVREAIRSFIPPDPVTAGGRARKSPDFAGGDPNQLPPPPTTGWERDEDPLKTFAWFDGLGLCDLKVCRFAKITTTDPSRPGFPSALREYGFICDEREGSFTVLGHGCSLLVHEKRRRGDASGLETSYQILDLEREARDLLENLEFMGKRLIRPRGANCIFEAKRGRGKHDWKERSFELFLVARACQAHGLSTLAIELCRASEAAYRWERNLERTYPLRAILEEAIPPILLEKTIRCIEEPTRSRKDLAASFQKLAGAFPPGGKEVEKARELAAILERMAGEDEAHGPAGLQPLASFEGPDRIEEMAFRLRDLEKPVWESLKSSDQNLVRALMAEGTGAVPALLRAARTDACTRISGSAGIVTVSECAFQIMEEIAGFHFEVRDPGRYSAGEVPLLRERLVNAWLAEVGDRGEPNFLAERAARGDGESVGQAKRLVERDPTHAAEPIIEGIRRAEDDSTGAELIEQLGKVLGDRSLSFLLEEVEHAVSFRSRLAAAEALEARGRSEGRARMLLEWKRPHQTKADRHLLAGLPDVFWAPLIEFLARSIPEDEQPAILVQEWVRRAIDERVKILEACDSSLQWLQRSPEDSPSALDTDEKKTARVIEAFLIAILDDRSGKVSRSDLRIGRRARICDLAAEVLAARFSAKHHFTIDSSEEIRDCMISAIRGAR